jgi:uncharacterized cofD-like protein
MKESILNHKKIVCLGGGIGTVNLIKGLKNYTEDITAIVSMADDGGSGGRLRRLYNILPPGDVASCMAALMDNNNETLSKLLTYRFPGDRYGKDEELSGHKLGNLMLAAATDITGSFTGAINLLKKLFKIKEQIVPATSEPVAIYARTVEGTEIHGEENIDLGKFHGDSRLDAVFLDPVDAAASPEAIAAIKKADYIIVGPGDLYTTVLPSIIIPGIKQALLESTSPKIFVVNVANKPFETKGYSVSDFVEAIRKHLDAFPFTKVIANNHFSLPLPEDLEFNYTYVHIADENPTEYTLFASDLVNEAFPLYHDHNKLAEAVSKAV